MMQNYLSKNENKISKKFEKNGFLISKNINNNLIKEIEKIIYSILKKKIKIKKKLSIQQILNKIHLYIKKEDLNKFRLEIINIINSSKKIRKLYFETSKKMLEVLVGNELVMQNRINLSIQLPNDDSSLLALHSDTWSGDSPYEVVVWLPLVNTYRTKSMFILKPSKYQKFEIKFKKNFNKNINTIYNKIKKDLVWVNVKRGEFLLFNQNLPHGNVINLEKDSRWSLNCRFKNIFSPYGDKKIGEFFSPITLRKVSEIGMNYKLPKLKK
jgi:sporadic carbohydrate cluster 2OG-Fe(II) oxygenase